MTEEQAALPWVAQQWTPAGWRTFAGRATQAEAQKSAAEWKPYLGVATRAVKREDAYNDM